MNSIQTLPVVGRSTILHIVPIDHCDNSVGKLHRFYGIRQISRFIPIRRWRVANSVHRTKTAATGTGLACNHESGSSTAPAIMYIGTVGFFTDSVQLIVFYRSCSGLVALHVIARRQSYSEPFRQAIRSIVCEHLFFRLNAPINVNYYEIIFPPPDRGLPL